MKDEHKTRAELLDELNRLRGQLSRQPVQNDDFPASETPCAHPAGCGQDFFAGLPDLFFILDREARFIDCRTSKPQELLLHPDEFIGKRSREVLPPDLAAVTEKNVQDVLATGESRTYSYSMLIGGQQKVYEARLVAAGENQVLAVVRDMTDLKSAEEALSANEARLKEAQRIAHVGDWEWDIATNAVSWSDELFRIYGYEPGSISPDYALVLDAMHPRSKDIFLSAIDAALKGERPFELDYTFFRKDGSEAILHTIGKVFRGPDGKPQRMVGIVQDITEQKKGEEALRESEERFRSFFDTVQDGILIADTAGKRFISANRTICKMLGYSREELSTLSVLDIHPPDDLPRVLDHFTRQAAGITIVAQDVPVKRKDNTVFYADISAGPLTLEGKKCIIGVFRDVAERKQVEETLRETNNRLRTLIETIPDLVIFKDSQGRHLLVNRAAESATGHPRSELLGKTADDLLPPETAEVCKNNDRQTMALMQPIQTEELVPGRDGKPRDIDMLRAPMFGEAGEVVGLIAVGRDITERKNTEKALRRANLAYKALSACNRIIVQATDERELLDEAVGIVQEDCEYRMVWIGLVLHDEQKSVRPVAQQGFDEGYLASLDVTWSETARGRGPTGHAIRTGKAVVCRDIHTDPSYRPWRDEAGKRGYASSTAVPMRLNDNVLGVLNVYSGTKDAFTTDEVQLLQELADNLAYGIVAIRTKQDHDRAEAALKENERFIRSILDTVDEGFIVIDRDFRIVTANKAYCDQAGRPTEQIIGKHCYEISHGTGKPCFTTGETCAVMNVFTTGEPASAVHRHSDGKGSMLYVETKAFPIRDSNGRVMSAIETVNNITERHLLQEERLKTQKLEAIGTLAGGIAHDFNNLLQGIFGYISLAKMCIDQKDRSLGMLEQAEQALNLSVNLTKQLLTFSKGGKPVKKIIGLRPVIENAVKFALSGSRVDYRLLIDEDLKHVEADEGQIAQVIQNIVLNADQAMPLGGTITISARNVQDQKKESSPPAAPIKYIEIAIRDTGVGIAPPYLQRIFDPYFTTKEKGSGLGLATSYSIIRNHGGAIDVESKVGKGSAFFVYLPVAREEKTLLAATTVPAAERKAKVLVMDDEELIRNIVGEQIKAYGHSVEFAENGERALEKFIAARSKKTPFDIVILDLTVRGGMGGRETLLRLLEIDPDVKTVVSSGYSEDAVIADHRKHGFAACLTKPFDLDDLRHTLNALLADPLEKGIEPEARRDRGQA